MFSSCHSVLTRRRTATMLEGTRAGRKRNSDPTPTGKTSRSSSMLVFAVIAFIVLCSEVRLVEILDTVCTNHEVSYIPRQPPCSQATVCHLLGGAATSLCNTMEPLFIKACPQNKGPYQCCYDVLL